MNDKSHNNNSGGGNSGGKKHNNRNRNKNSNKNRNRNRNRNNNPNAKNASSQSGGKSGNKKRYNNKRRSSSKKTIKLTGDAKIIAHYDTLLEQHNLARKKYYELFHRADPNQKQKLESKFMTTLEALRTYEVEQAEILKNNLRLDSLPEDHIYCDNNGVDPTACDPLPTEIIDEHVNEVMRTRPDYSADTEESSGSMEDYYNYKGLPIPQPEAEAEKTKN